MMVVVSLTKQELKDGVERYIDDNKPDQIVTRQMREWDLEWKPAAYESAPSAATHVLAGDLIWKSEYLQVVLRCETTWSGNDEGELDFTCSVASCGFVSSNKGTSRKVAKAMKKRLQGDSEIKRLLDKSDDSTTIDLCQARVSLSSDSLEERVWTDERTAEAIKRALWSSTDSHLDVLDLVTQLVLPTRRQTKLGHRAHLRIMEDCTYDACEQEGEDELVADLKIEGGGQPTTTTKRQKQQAAR